MIHTSLDRDIYCLYERGQKFENYICGFRNRKKYLDF